jgi:hypothetical protein
MVAMDGSPSMLRLAQQMQANGPLIKNKARHCGSLQNKPHEKHKGG